MRVTCPECGETFSGSGGGHCRGGKYGGCCRTFTSNKAGDKHRVGPFHPPEERRCLTDAEMQADGWRLTPRGWTPDPPMSDEAKAARRMTSRV